MTDVDTLRILWPLNHSMTTDQYNDLCDTFMVDSVDVDILKDIDAALADNLRNTPADIQLLGVIADTLLAICKDYDFIVFPVGSPAFHDIFHAKNAKFGIPRLYSDTARNSIDVVQPDGSVVKKPVFKHRSWLICTTDPQ